MCDYLVCPMSFGLYFSSIILCNNHNNLSTFFFQNINEVCITVFQQTDAAVDHFRKVTQLIPPGEYFKYNYLLRHQTKKAVEIITLVTFLLEDK